MNSPGIREATPGDAPRLVEFNCRMAGETEGVDLDKATVTAGVAAVFQDASRGFYLVAEADDGLAGSLMITTEWSDWRNGDFWWIQSVYVRPEYRRLGLYRALYRTVRDMAASRPGVCGFRLYVERGNRRAQQAYQALGMRPTAYLMYEQLKGDGR